MDCMHAGELMSLAIDQMLSEEEHKQFEKHINECSACREEYEMYVSIQETLLTSEPASLPENFHADLMNRINEEKVIDLHSVKKKRFNYRYVNAAAAILIVFVVGFVGLTRLNQYDDYETQDVTMTSEEKMSEAKMEVASVTEEAEMASEVEVAEMAEVAVFDSADESSVVIEESAEAEMFTSNDADMADATLEITTRETTDTVTMKVAVSSDEVVSEESVSLDGEEAGAGKASDSQLSRDSNDDNLVMKSQDSPENSSEEWNDQTTQNDSIPYKLIALVAAGFMALLGLILLIVKLSK